MKSKIRVNSMSFALLVTALGCAVPAHADWVSGEEAIMGTAIRVQVWHDDEAAGRAAIEAVMEEMHRIDRLMSTYKEDSEISLVNRTAAAGPVTVTPEIFTLVGRALKFSVVTNGAFDITYASVGYMYDYREGVKPDDEARHKALEAVDYRNVLLDDEARSVRFAKEGVRIDLGGVAKGYAVERGALLLRERGVTHGIVTAGGDSRIVGDRRGRPWTVGIRDPRDDHGLVARLPLIDEAISTSGDYERFFESEGVRYHHILKPGTGLSPAEVRSVTVIGPDATMTDALSTGTFVLGLRDGLALIDSLEAFEAVVIDADGQMHFSSGLSEPAQSDSDVGHNLP